MLDYVTRSSSDPFVATSGAPFSWATQFGTPFPPSPTPSRNQTVERGGAHPGKVDHYRDFPQIPPFCFISTLFSFNFHFSERRTLCSKEERKTFSSKQANHPFARMVGKGGWGCTCTIAPRSYGPVHFIRSAPSLF